MEITKEMLIKEIKTLQKANKIHAKYSIEQYKKVLKYVNELEKEKASLEAKVKERTLHLEQEMKEKELLAKELKQLAQIDQLTGLANRYLFLSEVEKLKGSEFSILFIDLDGFKLINDTYGHKVGDFVLKEIAKRMRRVVRKSDLIARLGGDEFTILLNGLSTPSKLEEIASLILKEIKKPILYKGLTLSVGASIGIYIYNGKDSVSDIIAKSDIAMYEAKRRGKGRFVFFNKEMKYKLEHKIFLKNYLKKAIKNREIYFVFQPIVNSISLEIECVEVLSRWDKASPGVFIEMLEEEIELLKEFTFYQLKEIFKIAKNFDILFSINISGKLLVDYELATFIKDLQKKWGVNNICFEVTETSLASNLLIAADILELINSKGFTIALDDFGTGYSSLAYIKSLPVEIIKIDRKFIENLSSPKDLRLFKAIVAMIEILQMQVILEGIENKEPLEHIKPSKFLKYQGFLFYKPMKLDELKKVVKVKSGANF